jgi:hypothetical protein
MLNRVAQSNAKVHANTHKFQDCTQPVFTDFNEFVCHLVRQHVMTRSLASRDDLMPWQRIHILEIIDGRGRICTLQPGKSGYTFAYVPL